MAQRNAFEIFRYLLPILLSWLICDRDAAGPPEGGKLAHAWARTSKGACKALETLLVQVQ